MAATKWCQPSGDQSRRILGPLIPAAKEALPKIALRVAALGPLQSKEMTVENKGKTEVRELSYFEADAEFEVAGKLVKVRPQCVVRPGNVVESGIRKLQMYAYFTVKGKDLGRRAGHQEATLIAGGRRRVPARDYFFWSDFWSRWAASSVFCFIKARI